MEPRHFPEATALAADDQPEFLLLPVLRQDGVVHSCWALTDHEMALLKNTKCIWVSQLTGEPSMAEKKFSDLSFDCPHCGSWLPTQEAYDVGRAWDDHTCLCGKTSTSDKRKQRSANDASVKP